MVIPDGILSTAKSENMVCRCDHSIGQKPKDKAKGLARWVESEMNALRCIRWIWKIRFRFAIHSQPQNIIIWIFFECSDSCLFICQLSANKSYWSQSSDWRRLGTGLHHAQHRLSSPLIWNMHTLQDLRMMTCHILWDIVEIIVPKGPIGGGIYHLMWSHGEADVSNRETGATRGYTVDTSCQFFIGAGGEILISVTCR